MFKGKHIYRELFQCKMLVIERLVDRAFGAAAANVFIIVWHHSSILLPALLRNIYQSPQMPAWYCVVYIIVGQSSAGDYLLTLHWRPTGLMIDVEAATASTGAALQADGHFSVCTSAWLFS